MKRIPAAILALLMLLSAALADGAVPTDTFAALPGFVQQDPGRVQLCVYVHNPETWRAGATIEPEPFFLNVDEPAGLLGDASMDRQDAVQKYNVISLGLHLYRPDADAAGHWDLVASPKGTKGVFIEDALVEAGPGFDVLMDRAEEALGYRPGDMDFLGKKSVRATLEWTNNARSTADPETLRRLDGILNGADFTIGSVNCPSPAFLPWNTRTAAAPASPWPPTPSQPSSTAACASIRRAKTAC